MGFAVRHAIEMTPAVLVYVEIGSYCSKGKRMDVPKVGMKAYWIRSFGRDGVLAGVSGDVAKQVFRERTQRKRGSVSVNVERNNDEIQGT